MNPGYQQVLFLSLLVHSVVLAATLVVAIVGWRRHRHVGYLVLITWVLVTGGSRLGQVLWIPWIHPFASKVLGVSFNSTMMMVVMNSLASIVSGLLLCVGIGLLVFVPARSR